MSGSLFDFGLYCFHNAKELLTRGSGPYFYLPKMESHLEARLWNDAFCLKTEAKLGIPAGSIKGTVLIETILGAFEMDEILWELKDHSAGLNCGRWDYIFSFIKKFAGDKSVLLPDRGQVTMTTHFMRSYSKLAIKTCHRRGVSAMGGMSAFIPIKTDPVANETALTQVRAAKEREATDGHDGTWVAHPGLVPVALEVFDRVMPSPNQIGKQLPDYRATAEDLLRVPEGQITEAGLRQNVAVGLGYVEAWLRGIGCVPLFNLMEDAATAEISRAQLWQWVHHGARLDDGRAVDVAMIEAAIADELARAKEAVDAKRYSAYERAADLMRRVGAVGQVHGLPDGSGLRAGAEGRALVPCCQEVSPLSFMTRHLAAPPALRNSLRGVWITWKPRDSSWDASSVLISLRMMVRSMLMALQAKRSESDSVTMMRFLAQGRRLRFLRAAGSRLRGSRGCGRRGVGRSRCRGGRSGGR